jgi:hypothetical protein
MLRLLLASVPIAAMIVLSVNIYPGRNMSMSVGGMVDPPPVDVESVGNPRVRYILAALIVIACLILVCFLAARLFLQAA